MHTDQNLYLGMRKLRLLNLGKLNYYFKIGLTDDSLRKGKIKFNKNQTYTA